MPSGAGTLAIGIVGGSISGCAAAVALGRAGHRVELFERSTGVLRGRGAGIGTPPAVIRSFRERGMIDAEMPTFLVTRLSHVARAPGERLGRTAWVTPFSIELFNWGDLYRSLRARIPDAAYHQGREVTGAETGGTGQGMLRFADGDTQEFDVVLFADGYRSLGRRLVCPEAELAYRGYVLWRGVLEEARLDDVEPLEGTLFRAGYSEGHLVAYLVPGPDSSTARGRRRVNWACYVRVPENELGGFLKDRHGRHHAGSVPPGRMRPEEEARLKDLARREVPPYFADIVAESEDTFVQAIFTAEVPRYREGRICLAGDAGAFVPPFTASGVLKGMNNGVDLAQALTGAADVDEGLEAWSAAQVRSGRRLSRLGRRMEDALIWSIPDFAAMDEREMRAWWKDAASLPEDLFPPTDLPSD